MSTTVQKPATTPIPVQLSEAEFEEFILPHLSMPKRGPKCKMGVFAYPTVGVYLSNACAEWPESSFSNQLIFHCFKNRAEIAT
jgi:hypothetical protein